MGGLLGFLLLGLLGLWGGNVFFSERAEIFGIAFSSLFFSLNFESCIGMSLLV